MKYSIIFFFTFINFSYYNFSSINLAFILNLSLIILVVLSETPPLKEKKIFQILLIFLVFMTHFYNFFRFRSSDEIYYIGLNFRSSSKFSSYFQQDFMEGFNNLILFFVNIFEKFFANSAVLTSREISILPLLVAICIRFKWTFCPYTYIFCLFFW